MTIRHDRSSTSIVSTCTRCAGFWFAFSFDLDAARASAERHERDVHGVDPREASNARRSAEKRKRRAAVFVK